MTFKEMKFKDSRVWVEVDAKGALVLENGRAVMKYRLDDERTYGPWPANLSEIDAADATFENEGARGARKAADKDRFGATDRGASSRQEIVAYTDGACLGNPGPAGLGYAVDFGGGRRIARGEPLGRGTNNIAELTAILRVLELVEERGRPLLVHTDSSYAIGVLTLGWKPKANQELIARIRRTLSSFEDVRIIKVKGHAGVPDNELVDDLARRAAQTQRAVEH